MKRQWFQDHDGSFYRNCPLVRDEIDRTPFWRWRKVRALLDEWEEAFHVALPRKDVLGPGDVLVEPMPMREAYPDRPIFWTLDEEHV